MAKRAKQVKKVKPIKKPIDRERTYRLRDSQVAFLRGLLNRMNFHGTIEQLEPVRLLRIKTLEALPSPPAPKGGNPERNA